MSELPHSEFKLFFFLITQPFMGRSPAINYNMFPPPPCSSLLLPHPPALPLPVVPSPPALTLLPHAALPSLPPSLHHTHPALLAWWGLTTQVTTDSPRKRRDRRPLTLPGCGGMSGWGWWGRVGGREGSGEARRGLLPGETLPVKERDFTLQ